jgi:hypothetical protein
MGSFIPKNFYSSELAYVSTDVGSPCYISGQELFLTAPSGFISTHRIL